MRTLTVSSAPHTHPDHPHPEDGHEHYAPNIGLMLLSHRAACWASGFLSLLVLRLALTLWALPVLMPQTTFPSGTIMANLLVAIPFGIMLGALEGRLYSHHKSTQLINDWPLPEFLSRMRLMWLLGSITAFIVFSGYESTLGVMARSGWPAFFAALSGVLAVLIGFITLWFAFSWARWFFGEIRWN